MLLGYCPIQTITLEDLRKPSTDYARIRKKRPLQLGVVALYEAALAFCVECSAPMNNVPIIWIIRKKNAMRANHPVSRDAMHKGLIAGKPKLA
jgi:hypothetical protein